MAGVAPQPQGMGREGDNEGDNELYDQHFNESVSGFVVKQEINLAEEIAQAVGIAYEAKNKYKVAHMPQGKKAKSSHNDGMGWTITSQELEQLPMDLFAKEESSCCVRLCFAILGWQMLRPFDMMFKHGGKQGPNVMRFHRGFSCGGACCDPRTGQAYRIDKNGMEYMAGEMVEKGSCCEVCAQNCCGNSQYGLYTPNKAMAGTPKYVVDISLCCCGKRHNNCCGATCFKNDLIFDILDSNGMVVGNIQKTYAPGSAATCRMCLMLSNYVITFPKDATADERATILGAVYNFEILYFDGGGN